MTRTSSFLMFAFFAVAPIATTGCTTRVYTSEVETPSSGWRFIGERTVNGSNDHDVIQVGPNAGRFNRIVLEAEGSDLELYNVVITFGDGQRFAPDTRYVYDRGTRSRVIDLPGGEREIQRIDFHYGNLSSKNARMIVRGAS